MCVLVHIFMCVRESECQHARERDSGHYLQMHVHTPLFTAKHTEAV